MWTAFLDGAIEDMLDGADVDATWRPYTAPGRVLRTRAEARAFIKELLADGRVVDPRAYGVEPESGGLIVRGTLEIRGPGGVSETPVFWAFCFRGPLVSHAAAFDRRDDALASLRDFCSGSKPAV
jgi:hypothetical protein